MTTDSQFERLEQMRKKVEQELEDNEEVTRQLERLGAILPRPLDKYRSDLRERFFA